ncbi:hypothetical protein, partial [Escherichia coli]|uniref:hypothetical protein n=1 Tax=Escherichia coli TaxID=562 RepID=UPI001953398A
HWYYYRYQPRGVGQGRGTVQSRYMGPADDLAIRRRAEVFNTIKELRRELAKQVDGLASRGMPRPAPFVGRVIE